MHHLIITAILRLIGLTVGRNAEVTARGIQGRMSGLLSMMISAVVPLFLAFAFFALGDPDPGDRWCSVLGFGLAGIFVLAAAHFWTFRLNLEGHMLRSSSLVTPDRQIDLAQAFTWKFDESARSLVVRQGGTTLAIPWMVTGHEAFREAVARHAARQRS
jgi:hypothetical protein